MCGAHCPHAALCCTDVPHHHIHEADYHPEDYDAAEKARVNAVRYAEQAVTP